MRKNYRLLKKLDYEKYNPTVDDITYFFRADKGSNGKLTNASVVVDRNVYVARDKDVIKCIIKPEPTLLGEIIPVSGNGDVTNDK